MESVNRLKPVDDFRLYKRNLPHFEYPGNFYFVPFATASGFVLSGGSKDIAFSSVKFHTDKKYKLYACVVMDTHVHIVSQPTEQSAGEYYSLPHIMHNIKSYSANRIQRLLNKRGKVWLNENYDRIIRDDEDYLEKMNYVIYNPVTAGLVNNPEDYKWLFYDTSREI